MAAEIRLFPCLSDNFGYLIHDPATQGDGLDRCAGGGADHQGAAARGLDADRHSDHPSPWRPCRRRRRTEAEIQLPRRCAARQEGGDRRCRLRGCARATSFDVGSLLARVLETPGHTLDHVSYVFDNEHAVFCRRHAVLDRLRTGVRRHLSDDVGLAARSCARCRTTSSSIAAMNTPRRTSNSR